MAKEATKDVEKKEVKKTTRKKAAATKEVAEKATPAKATKAKATKAKAPKAKETKAKAAPAKEAEVKEVKKAAPAKEAPAKEAPAKEAPAKEAKPAGKTEWEYSSPIRSEFVKEGNEKTRISIPRGKGEDGKTKYDQYFLKKHLVVMNKDGKSAYCRFPKGAMKHDDISVLRAGAEKSERKSVDELKVEIQNGAHSIQYKKPSLKAQKTAEATKEAGRE